MTGFVRLFLCFANTVCIGTLSTSSGISAIVSTSTHSSSSISTNILPPAQTQNVQALSGRAEAAEVEAPGSTGDGSEVFELWDDFPHLISDGEFYYLLSSSQSLFQRERNSARDGYDSTGWLSGKTQQLSFRTTGGQSTNTGASLEMKPPSSSVSSSSNGQRE